jgi:copper transport protein
MSFTTNRLSRLVYLFLIIILLIACGAIFTSTSVQAHTTLEKSSPTSGEIVKSSPSKIELWFQDEVVLSSNSITLSNRQGDAFVLELDEQKVSGEDSRYVILHLQEPLPSGFYTVQIEVLAPDGEPLKAMFQFVVDVENEDMDKGEMWRLLHLEKSFPEDGMIVQSSPKRIELWFTQESQLTAIGVFNERYEVISIDTPFVDPANPRKYIIPMNEELQSGTYTINWYAGIEGKERNGSIYFAVKKLTSIHPPTGHTVGSTLFKQLSVSKVELKSLADWFAFFGLLTLFGGTWFMLMIVKIDKVNKRWARISLALYWMSMIGLALLLLHNWLSYSYLSAVEFLILQFTWMPMIQIIIISIAYWMTKGKLQLVIFGSAILLWAFMGHSVQPRYGGQIGIFLNAFHLYAVAIWMGGLFALIVLTPKENAVEWLKEKGKAYSRWATWSIVMIIVTGILMTLQYVPSFTIASLFASDWGTTLGYKIILLSTIIVLGYSQRKRLPILNQKLSLLFSARAKVEIALGAIIVLAAAVLITFSPTEAEQGIYPAVVTQEGIEAAVQFSSFQIGVTDVTVQFSNQPDFEKVRVKFSMPPKWQVEQTAFALGDGTYRLTGNFIHSAGTMYMEVKGVTSDGQEIIFPFKVQAPGKMPSTIKSY